MMFTYLVNFTLNTLLNPKHSTMIRMLTMSSSLPQKTLTLRAQRQSRVLVKSKDTGEDEITASRQVTTSETPVP